MRGPLRKLLNGPNTYTKLSAAFVCLHPVSPSLVLPTAWPVSLGDDNAISLPLHYPTHHEQAMRKDLFLLIASLVSICAALVGVCVVISKNVHETARAKAQSEFNRQLSGGLDVFDEFFVSRARALRTIADALSALDPVVPTADQFQRVSVAWREVRRAREAVGYPRCGGPKGAQRPWCFWQGHWAFLNPHYPQGPPRTRGTPC